MKIRRQGLLVMIILSLAVLAGAGPAKKAVAPAGHDGAVMSLAISPNGKLLVSSGSDMTVRLWDAHTGKQVRLLSCRDGQGGVTFSRDGKSVIGVNNINEIKFWAVATGKQQRKLTCPVDYVDKLSVTADGKKLIAIGEPGEAVAVIDMASGKPLHIYRGGDVAMSEDGKLLARRKPDNSVVIRSAQTGKQVAKLESAGTPECFSSDGRLLATSVQTTGPNEASPDATLKIWDVRTGRKLVEQINVWGGIGFSPDGKLIGACPSLPMCAIRLIDVKTKIDRPLGGEDDYGVTSGAFSRDGRLVAAGGNDGWIAVWDTRTGKQLCRIKGAASGSDEGGD